MQQASAIALHHPNKLYKRNRGMLRMDGEDLHDFASTKGLTLRKLVHGRKRGRR